MQGEYLYIPIKEREVHNNITDYALEVKKRDEHFGNFLFEGECFSGYIDFDLSQKNIRIFDLCYFLLGLLCEEEAMAVTEEQWFRVLHKVFRGYMEINPLQLQEIQAVPYVMKSIELLFIAWFLGQKDMKCCEDAVKLLDFVDRNTQKILSVLKDFEE